jgi:y4mF family transcriptional regulator
MADAFADRAAAAVRARRRSLQLSQRDLAELAGVSERFVRFVEQGKRSIQLDSLIAVLETLGLELQLATRTRPSPRNLDGSPEPEHVPGALPGPVPGPDAGQPRSRT